MFLRRCIDHFNSIKGTIKTIPAAYFCAVVFDFNSIKGTIKTVVLVVVLVGHQISIP